MFNKSKREQKIGNRLRASFGLIALFISILSIAAMIGMEMISKKVDSFYNVPYRNNVTQMELRKDVQYLGKTIVIAMVSDSNSDEMNKQLQAAEHISQLIDENLQKLNDNFKNKELLATLNAEMEQFTTLTNRIQAEIRSGEKDKAQEDYNTFVTETEDVQDVLVKIGEVAENNAQISYNSIKIIKYIIYTIFIVVAVGCVYLTVKLSKRITKIIVTPLDELKETAFKLQQGDLDTTIENVREDEFGELATAFADTCNYLGEVINDINRMLNQFAAGDFTGVSQCEEKYKGEFAPILHNLYETKEKIAEAILGIRQTSEQVSESTEQIAEGSQVLTQGANDQATAIEHLNHSVTNVSKDVAQNAEYAKESNVMAGNVRHGIEEGNAKMQVMVQAMDAISESSEKIKQIIYSIDEIAEQTNLLALNASIESARAGEAGRGFAVVATEVGSLATQCTEAVKTSSELIMSSLKSVEHGKELANETAKQLEIYVKETQDLAKQIDKITVASDRQSQEISKVMDAVGQIRGVIEENTALAEENAASSEEMAGSAQELQSMVERFQL